MNTLSVKTFVRKTRPIMLTLVSLLLAAILILTGVLLAWSYPGKPKPILDSNGRPLEGSLSEKVFVEINGTRQGMIIQSRDIDNPVLLYLHGGMPDYFLTETYPTHLEEHFTVVWWEQRGSGISYSGDLRRETLNLEQMISDTIEVTRYLQGRFGKEKVYLMGHSGGTFIGIQTAARAPELYYGYIGVAQMSNQLQSERRAYDYMLQEFKSNGNMDMARKLESAPVTVTGGTPPSYLLLRDVAMHSLGIGTTHDMNSVARDLFLASLRSPQYTLREKYHFWHGKASSGVSALWDEMLATDLSKKLPELSLPVYFLHGVYDYTCSYTEAKAYFDILHAPVKGFYTFKESAHSPMFEEPDKTVRILLEDVLHGTNKLADAK